MSKSFFKRIYKEIEIYQKDNFSLPNLILKPSDSLKLWYFIIYNLKETDFEGGVYLGKVTLPDSYPFDPPNFEMLTPSNRFTINTKLCTTFSSYHKNLYNPSFNIAGMLHGLISFMTDDITNPESKGIGGIYTATIEDKKKTAINSNIYNMSNKINKNIFEIYFKEYYDILNLN